MFRRYSSSKRVLDEGGKKWVVIILVHQFMRPIETFILYYISIFLAYYKFYQLIYNGNWMDPFKRPLFTRGDTEHYVTHQISLANSVLSASLGTLLARTVPQSRRTRTDWAWDTFHKVYMRLHNDALLRPFAQQLSSRSVYQCNVRQLSALKLRRNGKRE